MVHVGVVCRLMVGRHRRGDHGVSGGESAEMFIISSLVELSKCMVQIINKTRDGA